MKRFQKTKFLSWKKFEDHMLIIDSRTKKQVHRLNEVGSFLWNSLDKNQCKEKLVESLIENYEISNEEATRDVQSFLNELLEKALIHE